MEYKREQFSISDNLVNGDFVAIDFETVRVHTEEFFGTVESFTAPCQIGIVVIENGAINDKKSFIKNIKPIGVDEDYVFDKSSLSWLAVHTDIIQKNDLKKFDAHKVFGQYPTIKEIWSDIINLIDAKPIVAHNAVTERTAFVDILNYYNLPLPCDLRFHCTMRVSSYLDKLYFRAPPSGLNMRTLSTCCKRFGIEFSESKHHDALYDATAAAELMLKMRTSTIPISFDKVSQKEEESEDAKRSYKSISLQTNPFDDRRVALIGSFNYSNIKEKLIKMGAVTKDDGKLNDEATKFTHYAIIGKEPNIGKMNKLKNVLFNGWDVKVISEQDFMNICNGFYDGYFVNETVGKNFHLTMEHFTKNHVEIMPERNPFLEDNIYVPQNVTHNRYALAQAIGNIGAYANYEIENASEADKSYPIIMLAQETIEKLKRGESDEIIQYIERTYNDSKSIRFLYQFISEDELTNWIHQRSEQCGDKQTEQWLFKN